MSDYSALHAISIMASHRISSLPIVDSHMSLIGALEEADIRIGLAGYFIRDCDMVVNNRMSDMYSLFSLKVTDYVRSVRSAAARESHCHKYLFPTAVRIYSTDNLSKVIEKLASTRSHRLYVTPSPTDFHLSGVCTLSDVINALF